LVLPLLYFIASAVLLVGFGRAGHGDGGEIFYYISLPSGAISRVVDESFKSGEAAMLSCLLAGLLQYFLLGYLLDFWLRRRRARNL
jgi:hypothetical protein